MVRGAALHGSRAVLTCAVVMCLVGAAAQIPDQVPAGGGVVTLSRLAIVVKSTPTGGPEPPYNIAVLNPSTGELKPVTNVSQGQCDHPRWSPDGTRIAFLYDGNVWVVPADGSKQPTNITQVPPDQGRCTAVDWSPVADELALGLEVSTATTYLWTIGADGTNPKSLWDEPLSDFIWHVRWSPDGRRMLFGAGRSTYLCERDGSGLVRFPAPAGYADWSPDGKRIAYACGTDSNDVRLWVSDPDGSDAVCVTPDDEGGIDNAACWSPDGTELAYIAVQHPQGPAGDQIPTIMAVRSDGSGKRVLATPSDLQSRHPPLTWSSDGKYVTYLDAHGVIGFANMEGATAGYFSFDVRRCNCFASAWSPLPNGEGAKP
jgi:Tol biopolymer transport system component